MTKTDMIVNVLKQQAGAGICDDCLGAKANVHPRQQVNQICLREGRIIRRRGSCTVANHGREKELNFIRNGEPPSRLPDVLGPKPPDIEQQTNIFSQWLFDATKLLDRVENLSHSKEPFAGRVSRLKREGVMSSSLAMKMQLLNDYRVHVVRQRKSLDDQEWDIAERYMAECAREWKQMMD